MITEEQKKVAEHYGWKHQALKLLEEMAEAQIELVRLVSGDVRVSSKKTIEELSDMMNVAQQFLYLMKAEEEAQKIISEKTSRQLDRIRREEFKNHPNEILSKKYLDKDLGVLRWMSIFD